MYKIFRKVEHSIYNYNAKGDTKIVSISDVHYSHLLTPNILFTIFSKIVTLKPDYITIPGDLLDSIDTLKDVTLRRALVDFLRALSNISPVIISYGNHEFSAKKNGKWVYERNNDFWNEIASIPNVTVADNKIYQDSKILIAGYTQPFDFYFANRGEYLPAMINDLEKQKKELLNPTAELPRICLIHSPYHLTNPSISKYFKHYDIILSGHMHEGMVPPILDDLINNNRGLIGPSNSLFPKNARGTVRTMNGQYIIINGGITKIAEAAPKHLQLGNLFYPMSIDAITLTSDQDKVAYQKRIKYEK